MSEALTNYLDSIMKLIEAIERSCDFLYSALNETSGGSEELASDFSEIRDRNFAPRDNNLNESSFTLIHSRADRISDELPLNISIFEDFEAVYPYRAKENRANAITPVSDHGIERYGLDIKKIGYEQRAAANEKNEHERIDKSDIILSEISRLKNELLSDSFIGESANRYNNRQFIRNARFVESE